MSSFNLKTPLGDSILFDPSLLPPSASRSDADQLWRCRKHKKWEASLLPSLPVGSAFLDVGAHFGDTVVTMALHARAIGRGDVRFFAFEPSPLKCRFIEKLVKANGVEGAVTVVEAAVGEEGGRRVVRAEEGGGRGGLDGGTRYVLATNMTNMTNIPGVDEAEAVAVAETEAGTRAGGATDDGGGCSGSCSGADSTSDPTDSDSDSSSIDAPDPSSFPMISLDSLLSTLSPVSFLHLDVEGWEARALLGATSLLAAAAHTPCTIVAEVWSAKEALRRGSSPTPAADIAEALAPFPHFQRLPDLVDQERNVVYATAPQS